MLVPDLIHCEYFITFIMEILKIQKQCNMQKLNFDKPNIQQINQKYVLLWVYLQTQCNACISHRIAGHHSICYYFQFYTSLFTPNNCYVYMNKQNGIQVKSWSQYILKNSKDNHLCYACIVRTPYLSEETKFLKENLD